MAHRILVTWTPERDPNWRPESGTSFFDSVVAALDQAGIPALVETLGKQTLRPRTGKAKLTR